MSRVLVVDDEPQILRALVVNMRARGYDVHTAGDGASALRVAGQHPPDLVILDLGLPDMEGTEVIAGLRGWTTAPIIVLTGRTEQIQKIAALDAGADDYVTKPFGIEELFARMRAVSRRVTAQARAERPAGGVGRRPRRPPGAARVGRRRGPEADAHRVADPRDPRAQPGTPDHQAAPAARGVGPGLRHRDQLPPALPRPAPPQAGARPRPTGVPAHRDRDGLPLPPRRRRRPTATASEPEHLG